ncbi:hypothetical protein EQG63_05710 [Flavobacterium amnicola]|uniref:Uncharacterized protein n=1 Tax=Flavobacterium amnicola TaxID=2506422 RepID=A0A4Q1K1U8_9FLAO|nr:hypothetical protein [Flavobacterium amnicola]RXR18940.1 hypothetical protein EQG63_05710 [Flavobacterium amnicola]
MKKKLEAELMSIAHRILKLKNKEDVRELHHETQKLYEKLSVLLFVEENFDEVKPTIGLHDIEVKLEHAFDFDEKIVVAELKEEEEEVKIVEKAEVKKEEKIIKTEAKPIETPKEAVKVAEALPEQVLEEVKKEEPIIAIPTPDKKQISFDDILNTIQPEPVFDRVSEVKKEEIIPTPITKIIEDKIEETPKEKVALTTEFVPDFTEIAFEKVSEKPAANLNDKMTKSSGLTLNDRVAFEKNLFDGSTEDLNRVISQIATFDNFEDAKNFIDEMVKPDYNEWEGKEEFASRFMEFVESKFA